MQRFCHWALLTLAACPLSLFAEESPIAGFHGARSAMRLSTRIGKEGAVNITALGGVYHDDRSLKLCVDLPNLEKVNFLCHAAVTDIGLACLKDKPSLTTVGVRGVFTDEGVRHLTTLPKLEYVRLYSDKLTDAALQSLAGITTLRMIIVKSEGVTEEAVEQLRKSLPECSVKRH